MEALALLGLGITRLSITPAAVGPIKELIQQVDLGQIRAAMDDWLAHPPADIRQALADWASAHGIDCD
jgi:phosphotransferase system enzyme I (PtsP)